MTGVLAVVAAVLGLLFGPWLAAATVRLADRDRAARPSSRRVVATTAGAAVLLTGAAALAGPRPAVVAFGWAGGAAVVLAGADLARHRLPDRVTFPALAVCALALLADAAVLGTWPALGRGITAAAVAFGLGTVARLVQPRGFGAGDVKLLGLLGLLLGWVGWSVLLAGVLAGFVLGALSSLLLIALGRAGWRTAVPFGPPLLLGACLALGLAAPLPMP